MGRKNIYQNWAFLHLLLESPSLTQKKTLVNSATKEQVKALAEVVANIGAGALPVPPATTHKLRRFRNIFREIGAKDTALKRRKTLLTKYLKQVLTLLAHVGPALKLMKK